MCNNFQVRPKSLHTNSSDATSWLSNIVPTTNSSTHSEPDQEQFYANMDGIDNFETRSILSPMKPVNLLPQVPLNGNSRKLSDHEEHDCEVIGKFPLQSYLLNEG